MELIKTIILGIVQGITEWLPISSTGHMILIDEFLQLNTRAEFKEMFFVVIQLSSIFAVILLYWHKLIPFETKKGFRLRPDVVLMWVKIMISCVPAAIVGILWDEELNRLFFNYRTVAIMLICFGAIFIAIERDNRDKRAKIRSLSEIGYTTAIWIGVFQLIAAVFPGTSRSGATIVGALLLGVSRSIAAEYTFFLAIPVMLGASALKLIKFGLNFGSDEILFLCAGMATAFITSVLSIRFLVGYIKRNDFTVFGWYRIILGCCVLLYFALN